MVAHGDMIQAPPAPQTIVVAPAPVLIQPAPYAVTPPPYFLQPGYQPRSTW